MLSALWEDLGVPGEAVLCRDVPELQDQRDHQKSNGASMTARRKYCPSCRHKRAVVWRIRSFVCVLCGVSWRTRRALKNAQSLRPWREKLPEDVVIALEGVLKANGFTQEMIDSTLDQPFAPTEQELLLMQEFKCTLPHLREILTDLETMGLIERRSDADTNELTGTAPP